MDINQLKNYRLEFLGAGVCLLLSMGFSVLSSADTQWYLALEKPEFSPPSWVFGPVWTILYLMMGAALGRLCYQFEKNKYLIGLFGIQFFLNVIWSPIFFHFQRIDLALLDMSVLWLCLVTLMYQSTDKRVVWLLFPYFVWLSFAWYLNLTLWLLNA